MGDEMRGTLSFGLGVQENPRARLSLRETVQEEGTYSVGRDFSGGE